MADNVLFHQTIFDLFSPQHSVQRDGPEPHFPQGSAFNCARRVFFSGMQAARPFNISKVVDT